MFTVPLTNYDIIALGVFLWCWLGIEYLIDYSNWKHPSLSRLMEDQRIKWMESMATRDMRIVDAQIVSGLQTGASFFGSASILAIGGSFALLGATDQVLEIYRDLPLPNDVTRQLWELQVFGLITIFIYSFFKFAWSYRLMNYCSIMVGAVPNVDDHAREERIKLARSKTQMPEDLHSERLRIARSAAEMNILGGRHFNAGLRGIFFALAYLGWFLGPIALMLSTIFVIAVLLRRQYFSKARAILANQNT